MNLTLLAVLGVIVMVILILSGMNIGMAMFLVGFVGATPVVKNIALKISSTKWGSILELLLLAGLLLVCTAYLVDGSFSPFLYFRF